MINSKGELETAVVDLCKNYDPDRTKPTEVRSAKSGVIYECQNFAKIPEGVNGCLGCYNWQNKDGTYVHAVERERDLE
jgi:hypothetical protein